MARGRRAVLLAAVVGAAALGFADDAAACTRWASERGNDRHAGTAEAPYRTLRQLVRSLGSGQIGCLVPGSTFPERLVVDKAGLTIRTEGSPRAVVVGGVLVIRGADAVRLEQLRVQGSRPRDPAIVEVRANGFQLVRSEVWARSSSTGARRACCSKAPPGRC